MNEQLLYELCAKYHINPEVPKAYLAYAGHLGKYHLDIPCGTGKTIGLAIALAVDPKLSIIYIASTHCRLREFVNVLLFLGISHHYVTSSRIMYKSNEDHYALSHSRVLIMTNCMYNLIPIAQMKCWYSDQFKLQPRTLVIDELPKFLLNTKITKNADDKLRGKYMTDRSKRWITQSVYDLVEAEEIYFEHNEFITNLPGNPWYGSTPASRIIDMINNTKKDHAEEFCATIPEVYTNKVFSSIILDATSDLYPELLGSDPMLIQMEKDYYKFIDYCSYTHIDKGFHQKNLILENMTVFIDLVLPRLKDFPGPYYVVTHKFGIYEEIESDPDDIKLSDEVKDKLLKYFKQVFVDENRDYIFCSQTKDKPQYDDFDRIIPRKDDLFISNYGRSRGSNAFRDCRTVVMIGTFYLPESEIQSALLRINPELDPKVIQVNLAVADAVQEISRGCIRKRKDDQKLNLLMYGDGLCMKKTIEYLGIKQAENFEY